MQNPEVIACVFEADGWALEKAEHQHHAGFTPIQTPSTGLSETLQCLLLILQLSPASLYLHNPQIFAGPSWQPLSLDGHPGRWYRMRCPGCQSDHRVVCPVSTAVATAPSQFPVSQLLGGILGTGAEFEKENREKRGEGRSWELLKKRPSKSGLPAEARGRRGSQERAAIGGGLRL